MPYIAVFSMHKMVAKKIKKKEFIKNIRQENNCYN